MEFVCSASRVWTEETGWIKPVNTANANWPLQILKNGKWVQCDNPPTLEAKVVGVNEFSDESYEQLKKEGYTSNEAEIIAILEMKNATS
jgi:hypothetical protein